MTYGRSPWKEVGVFDRETRSYVVDRIPRPPEARAIFERSEFGRESVAGHELKVGCSKCFNQTIVRWHRAYSDRVIDDFLDQDQDHPELMAVAVAREMQEVASRAERNAEASSRRAAEAIERAVSAEARFAKIQILRSKRRKAKERKRRSKNRGKK